MRDVNYYASPTTNRFHRDDHFVRALIGPIGSGKSVACIVEMWIKSLSQLPNSENIRKTRWVIIRNTYRELIDTTIQTFFDWIPESLGVYKKIDMKFNVTLPLPDGTVAQIEFLFRALDKPDDIKKLLSLEVTGGFINECREVPKAIPDMLIGRLGRYPNMMDGGPSWHGLIMDTNPPDVDHWFYKLFEVDQPDTYKLFHQPSGLSPEAENIANLPKKYYTNMQGGKTQEWINVYVHGLYGFIADGKPVWPQYNDDIHSTLEPLKLLSSAQSFIGIDFGLTPAAVFGQKTASGRWLIFDELVTTDMAAKDFGRLLKTHINHHYHDFQFDIYADPAGDTRAQTDEITPFQILEAEGIMAVPAYTNDVVLRIESVVSTLTRLDFAGNPGFVIGPKATTLRKAMSGGYHYKRLAVSGHEKFQDKPDKGQYSHVADALQYMMVGAGEATDLISSSSHGKKLDYSESDRAIL